MSILFCTPCYGGQVTMPYLKSSLDLREELIRADIDHSWLLLGNESLIQRARNNSVRTFLDSDYEFLFFIDSDIEFSVSSVHKLWELGMEHEITCGAYSMKRPDSPLTAWKDGKLVELEKFNGPVSVDYCGTGFLMIRKQVFIEMRAYFKELKHEEGLPGGEKRDSFAWFNPRVNDGIYLSEDYDFCLKAREMGKEIILDPSIKLGHWGTWRY